VAGGLISFRPLAPQALDILIRFSSVRPPMAETTDLSVCGVRISDLVTGRHFAASSPYSTAECPDRCALTGAADVYVFMVFSTSSSFQYWISECALTLSSSSDLVCCAIGGPHTNLKELTLLM
jgi:hypothetical protein